VVSLSARQEIITDFIFPKTAPVKTFFALIASTVVTPATPDLSTMAMPQQSSPLAIAPPSLEVNFKDEFIEELVESFYKSLKHCLFMIFKRTCTSFASWRPIFSWAIESIQDVRGATEAESLKKYISNLEKDISE